MEKKIVNPETEYLIVSFKHTGVKDKYITLWRPDNKGYCWPLELAGNYNGYEDGYHNHPENHPFPKSELSILTIIKDDKLRDCIKNTPTNRKLIKSK